MNKKPTLAKRLLKFLDGRGFYLVVLLCVSAVAISGWYLTRTITGSAGDAEDAGPVSASASISDEPDSEPVSGTASVTVPSPEADEADTATPVPVIQPETTNEPDETAQPDETTGPAEPEVPVEPVEDVTLTVPLVYTWPVKGEVLASHSGDKLVYNETMADWRVHAGLDISAAPGTNVLAAAAGTVTAVYDDDLMGTTVVIDHGEGMVSTYSNLQSVPTVEAGDTVYTGSIIGAVGTTAIAESATESHLHFEMTSGGIPVDPLDYLPEQ